MEQCGGGNRMKVLQQWKVSVFLSHQKMVGVVPQKSKQYGR